MHQIENEFLKVKVREFGAELTSVFNKKNNTEHLWQADEKFWGWHAPVLFPVVGRCLNDEIIIDGIKYPMEKHGFARKSTFKLLELSQEKMIFSLSNSEETFKIYPYRFEFLIGYRLKGNELHVSYEVRNKDDKPIYFQLGGHPAFAVPFVPVIASEGLRSEAISMREGDSFAVPRYDEYFIEFEQTENSSRHFINTDGFFDGRTAPVLANRNTISLQTDLFKDDALIFKDLKSRQVSIKSKKHSYALTVNFTGFNYLGLWAKENAPYVCIEPWLGCADTAGEAKEFAEREGIIMLEPGEEFNPFFTIQAT